MQKLMGLYRQAEALEQTRTQEELRLLAGSFRDSYDSVGDLTLMGMGSRAFASDSGYEGEIYYFLETKRGDWYTWTDARPTFYEGRRRPVRPGSSQPAPWELNCSREQLQELEIHLTNAKVAKGNRLSVSQETRGEVLGSRAQCGAAFYGKMVWDYRLLAQQYFLRPLKEQEETDHLALLGAARCGEASFDQVEQRFDLPLYDSKGRMIPVSLRYSREERYTIRVLERLQKRLRAEKNGRFAFFGRLYLQKGRLCLYPIEFFDRVVLPSAAGEPIGRGSFTENVEPGMDERTLQDFTDYLSEAEQALADLYQSGLDSVLEETVNSLNRLGTEGEELGLHLAGKKLRGMAEALQEKRHRMGFDPMPLLKEWAELVDYLNTCRELTAQDTVRLAMEPKEV